MMSKAFTYKDWQIILGSFLVLVRLQRVVQLVLSKTNRVGDSNYNICCGVTVIWVLGCLARLILYVWTSTPKDKLDKASRVYDNARKHKDFEGRVVDGNALPLTDAACPHLWEVIRINESNYKD